MKNRNNAVLIGKNGAVWCRNCAQEIWYCSPFL